MDVNDPSYQGPERRKDYGQLDQALGEVEKLHGAVTTLASAVTRTVPRQELVDLQREIAAEQKRRSIIEAALSFMIVLLLILFINYRSNRVESSTEKHHQVINCLLGKPEAQRSGDFFDTALVTCEATVNR